MKKNGEEAFDHYYRTLYTSRWEKLKAALLKPVTHVARLNAYASPKALSLLKSNYPLFQWDENCLTSDSFPSPEITVNGLKNYYLMDPASIMPAKALNPQPGEHILDMCAAPGGKTLILAEALNNKGQLTANDLSAARSQRLKQVLKEYLPEEYFRNIKITSRDATRWGLFQKETCNKILLDAPCSSERHVIQDPKELDQWSPSRIRNLAMRQYSLLSSAFMALKKGGTIIYSTCSLTREENDSVVLKLLKKHKASIEILPQDHPFGEKTETGWHILPDQTNFGPIFFASLRKKEI